MKSWYILVLIASLIMVGSCDTDVDEPVIASDDMLEVSTFFAQDDKQAVPRDPLALNKQLLESCGWVYNELRKLDTIQSLLDNGANVNYKGENGYTPLHAACFRPKNTEIVLALINAGADVNAKTDSGDTPLLDALSIPDDDGTPMVIIQLVDAGANVNVIDSWTEVTPLILAVRTSSSPSFLLDASIESWLHKLNEKDFVNSYGSEWLLRENIEHRRAWLKAVEKIIDAGADISFRNNSDTTRGRYPCGGSSVISVACLRTNVDMVQLLIEKGADVNERNTFNGSTPIIYAASNDKKEIISLLLKNKAKIDSKDIYGKQAIHYAAGYHHFQNPDNPETIQVLVDAGADPNAKASYGLSPLHIAVRKPKPKTIKMLIDLGADVNARDNDGKKPIDYAKENDALKDTDVYWKLRGASFE